MIRNCFVILALAMLPVRLTQADATVVEVTKTSQVEWKLDFFTLTAAKKADDTVSVIIVVNKLNGGRLSVVQLITPEAGGKTRTVELPTTAQQDGSTRVTCNIPISEVDSAIVVLNIKSTAGLSIGTSYCIKAGTYIAAEK